MQPGRELDKLVAERVMGWSWPEGRCPVCGETWEAWGDGESCAPDDCSMRPRPDPPMAERWPHYSTKIEDAWLVVDALTKDGRLVEITALKDGAAVVEVFWQAPELVEVRCSYHSMHGAPTAICVTALKVAVELARLAPASPR